MSGSEHRDIFGRTIDPERVAQVLAGTECPDVRPIPTEATILAHLANHPQITPSTHPTDGARLNLVAHIEAHSLEDTGLPPRLSTTGGRPSHRHQNQFPIHNVDPQPWVAPIPPRRQIS